jgi:anhydro-N-acetylmuramic acid kinase
VRVIGLMSGTSCDGIDAAAADLALDDDELHLWPLGSISLPYPADVRADVEAALPPGSTTMEAVCRLDTRIGQSFAQAAAEALAQRCGGAADLVVSHGQTLYHWLVDGRVAGSLQLGQPAWIAERTGLPVVSDLRARDIAAGGHGAPLVGLVDALLLAGRPGIPAALNLGGIANLTVVAPGAPPVAFDVGPANALIDLAVRDLAGASQGYDVDGRLAAAGQTLPALLERLLTDPYYALPAPKTTGREKFHLPYLRDALSACPRAEPADVVATLTRLTACTVAHACRRHRVTELVVSGGGTRNPTLMAMLAEAIAPISLATSDALGLPAQDKEAYAFAVLGFLTMHGVPGALPSATGAWRPAVLGTITPGAGPLALRPCPVRPPRALRIGTRPDPGVSAPDELRCGAVS